MTTIEVNLRDLMHYCLYVYPLLHIGFGVWIHRRSLKECIEYNESNTKPNNQIRAPILWALFFHRIILGLPHRVLVLSFIPICKIVYFFVRMFSSIITGKKLPKAKANKRLLSAFAPADFSGENGSKLAGIVIFFTSLSVALPLVDYPSESPYIASYIFGSLYALSTLLITASEFHYVKENKE